VWEINKSPIDYPNSISHHPLGISLKRDVGTLTRHRPSPVTPHSKREGTRACCPSPPKEARYLKVKFMLTNYVYL